jgi:hypothetical protein
VLSLSFFFAPIGGAFAHQQEKNTSILPRVSKTFANLFWRVSRPKAENATQLDNPIGGQFPGKRSANGNPFGQFLMDLNLD